jgi:hypothetical protein
MLKSIEEHDCEVRVLAYRPTGVACPNCRDELMATGLIHLTSPPKKPVLCRCCAWTGTILA